MIRVPLVDDQELVREGLTLILDAQADIEGNDTGGAIAQILVTKQPRRIARLVLASCEAFDNVPPGLPGQTSRLAEVLPGACGARVRPCGFGALAGLPFTPRLDGQAACATAPAGLVVRPAPRQSGDPPRHSSVHQGARHRRSDRRRRPAGLLRPAGASRLGQRGPGHAARARRAPRSLAELWAGPVDRRQHTLLPLYQPAEFAQAIGTLARRPA